MKKLFTLVAAAAATLMMSSCGLGTGTSTTDSSASSTSTTSTLLGAAASTLLGGSSTSSLASSGLSILSELLGGSSVSTNSIVGTWTYAQPQVSFESSNVLAKLGGEVVGSKASSMLGTQLEKIGLKAGVSTFTFDDSGKVTVSLGSKTTTGTYTLSGNTLTMTGALGVAKLTSTVTISGNQLYMLFNASSLFSALTKLGSSSSSLSSLLGNYSGMKLGWSMTK